MFQEFKKFALKGNVIDMAIGIIIGAGFGKIVSSLVNDIIMPPIGKLAGGIDFKNLFWILDGRKFETIAQAKESGAAILYYGNFIQTVFDFTIVALSIFFLIKLINRLSKKENEKSAEPTQPTQEVVLLTEIRDLLKKN